jgi:hypothetical protein
MPLSIFSSINSGVFRKYYYKNPVSGGSTNTPLTIPGLFCWLDASVSSSFTYASSNNISVWADKSGNGNNATRTSYSAGGYCTYNATGFYGQPAVYFPCTAQGQGTGFQIPISNNIFSSGLTVFAVFNTTSSIINLNCYFTSIFSSSIFDFYSGSVFGTAQYALSYVSGEGIMFASMTTPSIFSMTYNSAKTITEWVNGGSQSSCASNVVWTGNIPPGGSAGTLTVGTRPGNDAVFNGYISEFIVYNTILTQAQRQQIEGYLASKWGITSVLPPLGTHPYGSNSTTAPQPPDIIWYKCDSTTKNGSTLINAALSGSNYNATIQTNGSVTQGIVAGKNAITVTSTSNNANFVVTTPLFALLGTTGFGYTLSFWFYHSSSSPGTNVATKVMTIGNTGSAPYTLNSASSTVSNDAPSISGNALPYVISELNGSPAVTSYTTSSNSGSNVNALGNWNHFALVVTSTANNNNSSSGTGFTVNGGGAGSQALYINGQSIAVGTALQGFPGTGSSAFTSMWSMALCNYNASISYSDIRVYKQPLNSSQISNLYNNPYGG